MDLTFDLQVHIVKWLVSRNLGHPCLTLFCKSALKSACEQGRLETAKLLLCINPTIIQDSFVKCDAFKLACENGHLEVAKLLYSIAPDMNVSTLNHTFRWTCAYEHLEVAKWLLSIKPEINVFEHDHWSFRHACLFKNIQVVKWLQSLYPDKYAYKCKNLWFGLEIIPIILSP